MDMNYMTKSFPILHVEDDEIDVALVKRALKKANITNPLYNACDGIEALEVLSGKNADMKLSQPCVMLIDINMPRMDGIELLQELRNNQTLKQNVVFVLTTSNDDKDKTLSYDLNIAGYVLKENLSRLMEMLSDYCEINEFPDNGKSQTIN